MLWNAKWLDSSRGTADGWIMRTSLAIADFFFFTSSRRLPVGPSPSFSPFLVIALVTFQGKFLRLSLERQLLSHKGMVRDGLSVGTAEAGGDDPFCSQAVD